MGAPYSRARLGDRLVLGSTICAGYALEAVIPQETAEKIPLLGNLVNKISVNRCSAGGCFGGAL
jgi:hypothetical protein